MKLKLDPDVKTVVLRSVGSFIAGLTLVSLVCLDVTWAKVIVTSFVIFVAYSMGEQKVLYELQNKSKK